MSYIELLKHPFWQKKRLIILSRDNFECQGCSCSTKTLHVHHKFYIPENPPWDYPDEALITLCASCHESEERRIKECSKIFIDAFKMSPFMADDLIEIASGISQMKGLQHIHNVVASAYMHAFASSEMQTMIIGKYFEYLKEKNKIYVGDTNI